MRIATIDALPASSRLWKEGATLPTRAKPKHKAEIAEKPRSQKRLLIIGDWVVDDNWLTGIHRSSTSLRTGATHSRTLHTPGSPVQAFCGAGRLASILYGAKEHSGSPPLFHVSGVGVWKHQPGPEDAALVDDTNILRSLFSFDYRKRQAPSSLECVPLSAGQLPPVELHNLAPCLTKSPAHEGDKFATTRACRIFQRREGSLTLVSRTDWEILPIHTDPLGTPAWVIAEDTNNIQDYLDENKLTEDKVDAVIIKDLIKGVVTDTFISILVNRFRSVPWFVSTKRWRPPWLSWLSQVNLKLLLIPPIAASTALGATDSELDSWICPSKPSPTKEAMCCIGNIEDQLKRTSHNLPGSSRDKRPLNSSLRTLPLIVVSPQEGSVLAKKDKLFIVHQRDVRNTAPLVGWATAFFSALCAHVINDSHGLKIIMDSALAFAQDWASKEAKLLEAPDLETSKAPPPDLFLRTDESAVPGSVEERYWDEELQAWDQATASAGIIDLSATGKHVVEEHTLKNTKSKLELWRGMTALKGYICFKKDKRKELSRLAHTFSEFASHGIDHHQSVQIIADPGSGKTHLVECLANACGLRLLPFNITHMNHREDIISCFDTIVTTQAIEKQRPLLVFFDEINALVSGYHVYDAFLSPLEESLYERGGRRFHIRPCVWVFAGTGSDGKEVSNKYQDFESRLTLSPIILRGMSSLEKIYLGAQLVRRRFPDVHKISNRLLDHFGSVPGSVRELRNVVNTLRDVQGGQVGMSNFPGNSGGGESWVELI